jgi:hypothetical protein
MEHEHSVKGLVGYGKVILTTPQWQVAVSVDGVVELDMTYNVLRLRDGANRVAGN